MSFPETVTNPALLYRSILWDLIRKQVDALPDKPCVVETTGKVLTYQELVARVDAAAETLTAGGFSRGDRVLFLARTTIQSVVYLLAIIRAGGVLVAADPAMGRESFHSRVALPKPAWIILDPLLYALRRVPLLEKILRLCGAAIPDIGRLEDVRQIHMQRHRPARSQRVFAEIALEEDDDALIVYTSGTTSLPKGVVHTYRSIISTLALIKSDLAPQSEDIFYASQSYFLLMAFLSGATAILPSTQRFNPKHFLQHVRSFGVTKAFLIPAEGEQLITYCRNTHQVVSSNLKTLMFGSAPVLQGFLRRLASILSVQTEVLCIYGATEILPIARISMKEKLTYLGRGDVPGGPFPQVHVSIENGELVATGPNIASRYLEGATLEKYVTGDLGELDAEGRLILLGRKKDMIVKGNHNVYPTLFESVISQIPGVRACALVGVYREVLSDEEIVLVVEPVDETRERELRVSLKQQLRSGPHSIDVYAQPDHIFYMDLPLAGRSKKINKNLLREKVKALLCV